jgi:hypothetical protein
MQFRIMGQLKSQSIVRVPYVGDTYSGETVGVTGTRCVYRS